MEKEMQKKVRTLCRLEYVGEGYYAYLAKSYAKDKQLSKIFRTFSAHESGHGVLFGKYYAQSFGKSPSRGRWVVVGKVMAFCQCILPLKWKLKMLEKLESGAVKDIEIAVKTDQKNGLIEILEKILPHEKAHAGLYKSLYE